MLRSLVGSEMCIRDSINAEYGHYEDAEWDFVKGALSTVDRRYGGPLDAWMHHITNGHVVHHIFSHMAFYNAIEATPYVAKKLGRHYHYDDRNLFTQIREGMFHHQSSWKTDKIYQTVVAPSKKGANTKNSKK
eukprot:TRINITY_DN187_c0_g1_i8.p1 TRINITY_DN187_c0_g1~~TRINITY_DN187_c0_g1_i8.p1  ORF type:complete len:133 (-),score=50.20 TRINITY_DN187_c0_g1_i8:7-405(-)